jgi:hypothetical protein
MTASALVLFAPLLLEHDDLLILAVADDGGLSSLSPVVNNVSSSIELPASASSEGTRIVWPSFDQELFAAGSDNCM